MAAEASGTLYSNTALAAVAGSPEASGTLYSNTALAAVAGSPEAAGALLSDTVPPFTGWGVPLV